MESINHLIVNGGESFDFSLIWIETRILSISKNTNNPVTVLIIESLLIV